MNITETIARDYRWFKNIPFLPILIDEQVKVFTLLFRPRVFRQMMLFNKWLRSHDGVRVVYHKYGGLEYRKNNREICHMHGDGLIDIRTTRAQKKEGLTSGYARNHHVLPETGMISFQIENEDSLAGVKSIINALLK